MFYFDLFLIFLYFKITRVHRKEEKHPLSYKTFDLVVALNALLAFFIGIGHYGLINVIGFSFLFFIIAALLVTAVQVGIFIEGKPLFGVSLLYKLLPILPVVITLLTPSYFF